MGIGELPGIPPCDGVGREPPQGILTSRSRNMATDLSLEQMKQLVKDHFEDFVNKRKAAVIRKNMTPDFYDHDGPAESLRASMATSG